MTAAASGDELPAEGHTPETPGTDAPGSDGPAACSPLPDVANGGLRHTESDAAAIDDRTPAADPEIAAAPEGTAPGLAWSWRLDFDALLAAVSRNPADAAAGGADGGAAEADGEAADQEAVPAELLEAEDAGRVRTVPTGRWPGGWPSDCPPDQAWRHCWPRFPPQNSASGTCRRWRRGSAA